jgi:small subunit ribosomal protein S18
MSYRDRFQPSGSSGGDTRSGPPRSGGRRPYNADDDERPEGGRGRFAPVRRVCQFCLEKTQTIDYKDVSVLRRFITERGKIKGRRKSGTCARHQRRLATAIKRARHLALLPFTAEHMRRY